MINKDKLDELFGSLDKSMPVAILNHSYPDPDSLGASAGIALLLKDAYGLNSRTYSGGSITHPQNKTIKNILHVSVEDIANFNPDKVSAVVVVDTDLVGTGLSGKVKEVTLRIDHHLMSREERPAKLSDIRIAGSACSIVWQYLDEMGIKLEEYPIICTALIVGIMTDTFNFTSQDSGDLDIDAFRSLIRFADKNLMAKINNYPLPKVAFEVEAKVFKDKEINNGILFSYAGNLSQNRDLIATIASKFIRIDCVEFVCIVGLVNNDLVVSVRSEDSRTDVDALIANIFGRQFGGGKEGSGGASFPLGRGIELIDDKKIREAAINEIVNGFRQRLFEVLGENIDNKET